ncbi:MAG: chromate resistance protein ChrB [Nitrospira sp.]|nr:chromate resistance protein ChrB [Nitrospira sp.]
MKWLFFSYSLPAEPSKARVFVWRQLKKIGAVNLQTVWVIPYSSENVHEIKRLIEDIERYKGEGLLIEGKALNKAQEESINKAFIESRNEEYRELVHKCEEFFAEIKSEIERKNFIFAEVEENEEELEKLKQWLKKVEKRDVVKVPLHKVAVEKIKSCEKVFEAFAKRVYEHTQSKKKK